MVSVCRCTITLSLCDAKVLIKKIIQSFKECHRSNYFHRKLSLYLDNLPLVEYFQNHSFCLGFKYNYYYAYQILSGDKMSTDPHKVCLISKKTEGSSSIFKTLFQFFPEKSQSFN